MTRCATSTMHVCTCSPAVRHCILDPVAHVCLLAALHLAETGTRTVHEQLVSNLSMCAHIRL